MATISTDNQTGQRRLGPYVLLREAGRGGMSQVFEAVDTRLGRTVALKMLVVPPHLSPAEREALAGRLKREAQALGSLSHPNVVTIFDVGEHDGQAFLVMEYLDGVTLRQRLDSGPLSPDEAQTVLSQVAAGLDAVHARGVVHRDLKPSNVMLLPSEATEGGRGGQVKLMDFGVARAETDTTLTQIGTMVGSPAYMAPEQIEGSRGGPAADVWALGVLLFEMLTGRPPFGGDSIPAVLYQIAHGDPAALPAASPAVQGVLRRGLEKDPAKRFASARALADAFAGALAAEANPPVPPPAAAPPRPVRAAAAAPAAPKDVTAVTSVYPAGGVRAAAPAAGTSAPAPPLREARRGRGASPWPVALAVLLCLAGAAWFLSGRLRSGQVNRRDRVATIPVAPTNTPVPAPRPPAGERANSPATTASQNGAPSSHSRPRPAAAQSSRTASPATSSPATSTGSDAGQSARLPASSPDVPDASPSAAAPVTLGGRDPSPEKNGATTRSNTATERDTGRAARGNGASSVVAAPVRKREALPGPRRAAATGPVPADITEKTEKTDNANSGDFAADPDIAATKSNRPAGNPTVTSRPAPPARSPRRPPVPVTPPPATNNSGDNGAPAPAGGGPDAGENSSGPAEESANGNASATSAEAARAELRGLLNGWLAAHDARDVDGIMGFYAPRLRNFYAAPASFASVRRTKAARIGRASRVNMDASDVRIRLAPGSDTASMTYRKRYTIVGGTRSANGSLHSILVWQRSGDGWKIVSEYDLGRVRAR